MFYCFHWLKSQFLVVMMAALPFFLIWMAAEKYKGMGKKNETCRLLLGFSMFYCFHCLKSQILVVMMTTLPFFIIWMEAEKYKEMGKRIKLAPPMDFSMAHCFHC